MHQKKKNNNKFCFLSHDGPYQTKTSFYNCKEKYLKCKARSNLSKLTLEVFDRPQIVSQKILEDFFLFLTVVLPNIFPQYIDIKTVLNQNLHSRKREMFS